MTSVRVWNGSAWDSDVQYNTADTLLGKWEQWHPPVVTSETGYFQARIDRAWVVRTADGGIEHDYQFASGLDGWHGQYATASASGGGLMMPQMANGVYPYPQSDYFYSPYFNIGRYTWHMQVTLLRVDSGPMPSFRGNVYYDGLKSNSVTYKFNNVGEVKQLEWPAESINGLASDWQCYVWPNSTSTPASEVTSVNYWDGDSWNAQNAY